MAYALKFLQASTQTGAAGATAIMPKRPSPPSWNSVSTAQRFAPTSRSMEDHPSAHNSEPGLKRDEGGDEPAAGAASIPSMTAQVQTAEKSSQLNKSSDSDKQHLMRTCTHRGLKISENCRQQTGTTLLESSMVEAGSAGRPAEVPGQGKRAASCAIHEVSGVVRDGAVKVLQQQLRLSKTADAEETETKTNDVGHIKALNVVVKPSCEKAVKAEEQGMSDGRFVALSQGFRTTAATDRQVLECKNQDFGLDAEDAPELCVPLSGSEMSAGLMVNAESAESQGFSVHREDLNMEIDPVSVATKTAVLLPAEVAMMTMTESMTAEANPVDCVVSVASEPKATFPATETVVPIGTEQDMKKTSSAIEARVKEDMGKPVAEIMATEADAIATKVKAIEPEREVTARGRDLDITAPKAKVLTKAEEVSIAAEPETKIRTNSGPEETEPEEEDQEPKGEQEADTINLKGESAESQPQQVQIQVAEQETKLPVAEPETDACLQVRVNKLLAVELAFVTNPSTDKTATGEESITPIGVQTETTSEVISGTRPVVASSTEK